MSALNAQHLQLAGNARAIILRGGTEITLEEAGADSAAPPASWAHIARVGEWKGHPAGAFQITKDHLVCAKQIFDAAENDVPFDYEHSSTLDGAEAPASGWVKKLEIRGDDLWAFVEWTPKAADYIKNREYRFASSVLFFNAPDRESGEEIACRLHSVALTNTPFMDGLNEIKLAEKFNRALADEQHVSLAVKEMDVLDAAKKGVPAVVDLAKRQKGRATDLHKIADRWRKARLYTKEADVVTRAAAQVEELELTDRSTSVRQGGGERRIQMGVKLPKKAILAAINAVGPKELTEEGWFAQIKAVAATMEAEETAAAAVEEAAVEGVEDIEMSDKGGAPAKENQMEVVNDDGAPPPPDAGAGEGGGVMPYDEIMAKLCEATGMGPEEVASAVEANMDAVVAALGGAAMNDTSGEGSDVEKELAEKLEVSEAKVQAMEPQIKALSDRLAVFEKRDAEAAAKALDAEVDKLIEEKRLAPEGRASMRALAEKSPVEFRKLSETLKPMYPAGREASALPVTTGGASGELDGKHPRVVALREQFGRAGIKDPKIVDKYVRAELAKQEG